MQVESIKFVNYSIKTQDRNVNNESKIQVTPGYSPAVQLPNYKSVSSKFPLNVPNFSGNSLKGIEEINQGYLDKIETAKKEID